jgi:hypothetical protein
MLCPKTDVFFFVAGKHSREEVGVGRECFVSALSAILVLCSGLASRQITMTDRNRDLLLVYFTNNSFFF